MIRKKKRKKRKKRKDHVRGRDKVIKAIGLFFGFGEKKEFKIGRCGHYRVEPTTHLLFPARTQVPFFSKLPSAPYVGNGIYDPVVLEECEVRRAEGRINRDVETAVACQG